MEDGRSDASATLPLLHDEEKQQHSSDKELYEPHQTSGNASFFKICFNGFNALSGIEILSIPYALSEGGWLSLILLFIIAAAAFYSGVLIQFCMGVDPYIRTYPNIGDNLHNILPEFTIEMAGMRIGARESFVIIAALVILPSVWVNNLSILAYVSASGVLASFVILAYMLSAIVLIQSCFYALSSVFVALAISLFGYLMSLVGAFLSVTASILLPCLCYVKIMGAYRTFGLELIIIGVIILLGVLLAVIGTYTSLLQIVDHL
ncbi:Amino acid transporter, transmembrane domain [Dillenia turbinata]|uniref:Amino acid transporter, transmembrane domain n=1 Tax=Dillenia turbinata TaxID=194707 RepID=A0AAN8YU99_9MAGN